MIHLGASNGEDYFLSSQCFSIIRTHIGKFFSFFFWLIIENLRCVGESFNKLSPKIACLFKKKVGWVVALKKTKRKNWGGLSW
jgi:hypothetical protein